MKYDVWKHRIMGRTDITSRLTHLTKAWNGRTAYENLLKILENKCLYGSTTESGYIRGSSAAVCFQEVPLLSLAENIIYENKLAKETPNGKVRYEAYGIRVNKQHAFSKGAREVIYGKPSELTAILPDSEQYRIVCHNLDNYNNTIDWTHEREWRIKGDYQFKWSDIEVIVPNAKEYKKFVTFCVENDPELLLQVNGIICLDSVIK